MNTRDHHRWSILLVPLSWLYGMAIWTRNFLYDTGIFRSTKFNIPVISVGNLTVGGTGKTPHVEYLAELLAGEFRIATLSRGYRRRTRDFRIADLQSTAEEIGDEPCQIKHRFPDITVAVDRKRYNGIDRLLELDPPVDVILLDDAFQHRAVHPGLSILLMDYYRPVDRDRLLPAGRLREPAGNSKRADIILITRSPESIKSAEQREYSERLGISTRQHLYFTSVRYGQLIPVYEGSPLRDAEWYREHADGVLIVAGIAQPRHIRQFARTISTSVHELLFPDHHSYSSRELERITGQFENLRQHGKEILVLTTEKDAVRLKEFNPPEAFRKACHAIRIHIHFPGEDQKIFNNQIKNYVTSNKRSHILYQGANSANS
jgi:tetraacyldisaccharide 4'-kinase